MKFITLTATPRASQLIADAEKIAAAHGHNYLGTEHILLACSRFDSPPINAMFCEAKLNKQMVAEAFGRSLSQGFDTQNPAKERLIIALREALAELEK